MDSIKVPATAKNFLSTTGGVVVSLGVLFVTIFAISYAWKKGQTATK